MKNNNNLLANEITKNPNLIMTHLANRNKPITLYKIFVIYQKNKKNILLCVIVYLAKKHNSANFKS